MVFKNKIQLMIYLSQMKSIGSGSQGICYLDSNNNKIYKVFHQFFDESDDLDFYHTFTQDEILKFSNIKNNTFIWANDVIFVNNEIVGYISNYVNAGSLYETNPLHINLNNFINNLDSVKKDLSIISNNGIRTFDMMYNILYNDNGFFVIDHDEYSFSDLDVSVLYKLNCDNFNREIMYFLVDNYFDEFINRYSDLNLMYNERYGELKDFLTLFKSRLSEVVGYEIKTLNECSMYLNKTIYSKNRYQRILVDR